MTYQDYQKKTFCEKNEVLLSSVQSIVSALNDMRACFNANQFEVDSEVDNDGNIKRLAIHCPYDTLAWKLALLLEASSIVSVSVDGDYVYVD